MWCSRIHFPFKKLLEYNPKYFSKNGFIQMIERSYKDGEFKAGAAHFIFIALYATPYRDLNHYGYDYSHEGRKTVAYRLFNSAKLIQQAWRTFKLRPETLAKQVWNNVRNDGTPDNKKYLGMTPHVHYSLYDWVEEKKIQLWIRLCNETYKNVSKILLQKGYVIIRGSNWTNQLKWLHNPEYYRIDKNDKLEYLIRVTECEKYKVNSIEVKAMCARVARFLILVIVYMM
ncbi:hypothetical protein C1646_765460 [Rhizophagus diaphanus]|nr:hypothetical protein C1646_765460 [Rhizophagus diaphanus] [Rhizophagus sp. MUCL 43196]